MENIFLVGFMCSGKSTLGRLLAESCGMRFIDLDNYIQDKNQMSVSDLFAKFGEATFRKIERDALHDVAKMSGVVIATGGGTPCFFDNMQFMLDSGRCVYLYVNPNLLVDRLVRYSENRPLLKGKSREEINEYLCKTLPAREIYYKKAHKVADIDTFLNKQELMVTINQLKKGVFN